MDHMDKSRKKLIPAEPVVMLTLIGLLLIGAVLYYRAINFQRFLEPSLAVLEPRTTFSSRLRKIASSGLGSSADGKIRVNSTSIMLHKSLFTHNSPHTHPPVIGKLARVLREILSDPWMTSNIDLVMVKTGVPLEQVLKDPALAGKMQKQADAVLNALLASEPMLGQGHSRNFAAAAVYTSGAASTDWVTLDLIPSERLHIEVLERLGKYAHKPSPTN